MTTRAEALEAIGRLERADFQIGDGQRLRMLAILREAVAQLPDDADVLLMDMDPATRRIHVTPRTEDPL
jgi:hypothetical protein